MDKPNRVLVALDGSPLATDALDHALAVFPEADLTALNVIVPLDASMSEGGVLDADEDVREGEREGTERIVEAARRRVDEHEATVTTASEAGQPAEAIIEYAENHDVDHVVMGSHGRDDLSRILLGSVAANVVERSPIPVTVVR